MYQNNVGQGDHAEGSFFKMLVQKTDEHDKAAAGITHVSKPAATPRTSPRVQVAQRSASTRTLQDDTNTVPAEPEIVDEVWGLLTRHYG
jgi:hypothetical protein